MPAHRLEQVGGQILCAGYSWGTGGPRVWAQRGEIGYDGLTGSLGTGSFEDLTVCLSEGDIPFTVSLKKINKSLAKL